MRRLALVAAFAVLSCLGQAAPAVAVGEGVDAFEGTGTMSRARDRYSSWSGCAGDLYDAGLDTATFSPLWGSGSLSLDLCVQAGNWPTFNLGCDDFAGVTGTGTLWRWDGLLELTDVARSRHNVDWFIGGHILLTARYHHTSTGDRGVMWLSVYRQGGKSCDFSSGSDWFTVVVHGWLVPDVPH